MASVQSAPPMPQGGVSLPPGTTPQMLKDYYAKFQQMKAQGAGEDNAEYMRLHGILTAAQQQQGMQRQRRAYAQQQQQLRQQQQQQQQQQNGGVPLPNGINGVKPQTTTSSTPSSQPNATATSPGATGPGKSATMGMNASAQVPSNNVSKTPQAGGGCFTSEQLSTLRNQIFAFKLLSKNLGIPPNVQQQLFPSQQAKRSASTAQAVTAAGQVLDQAAAASAAEADGGAANASMSKRRQRYETFSSPYEILEKSISYADYADRRQRRIIPSILPPGVNADRVREERQRIVYNRIVARRAELEKLPANLAFWDTRKSEGREVDDSMKLKALLEYKMLCLLPKQQALRAQVSREMVQNDTLAMTANRSLFRRLKKQSLREARITEKLEKQQRDAKENREKKKHLDYLNAVLNHTREVQAAATAQKQRLQKLGRLMMTQHQQIEKEEQKRIERTAKQRLQALKANDEEAYLALIDKAKDTRITHLLKQTDGFLNQLAASVKQQQRNAAEHYGDQDISEDEVDDDEDEEEGSSAKIDYYQVAHRIKEEVKAQPQMLLGGTLKEYQLKGLEWMISLYNNNLNGILADEMGLGKTIQTISLVTYLIEKKQQSGPFLVIVPLSTLTNWNLEFEKWAPGVTRIVYKGPPTQRKTQQQAIRFGQFQVLLTTYEFIIKDRPILSKIKWVHMIVDEGHRMKNAQSKLSNTLTQYYTTRYRLILTGTPLQNNLPELWALLNFVLPNIFKSVKSFDEWFNTPFANTGGSMELSEEESLLVIRRLHKVLRPFLLRRLKKDVEKDLPEKQERVIKCVFSSLQARLYKQMMTDQKIMVSDGKGGKTGIRGLSNMLMQLRKLCNHPYVFQEVEDQINPSRSIDDSLWRTAGKFELLDRVLPKFQRSGHRVLMFFQMTAIMNIMEDYMRFRGTKYLRLDGTTKSDDRSDLLRMFNAKDSEYFIFLLSTRAGGLGLNLQTADTVIIFDSDWNPHQDLQAQDRAHRIGQKNEVRILRLISSNSIEEKILERAQYKLDMDGKVIQAGKFDNKSTNEEREQLLRTLMESVEVTEDLNQEEMDDDDLNLIMARSEDELELFKKMDEERETDCPYGPNKKLPRLMTDSELPDIYLTEGNPVVEEAEEIAGRGARQRTQVKYDDGLTEEQWLNAVDADDDTPEDAVARKQARIAKRQSNKEKRSKAGIEDSPAPSRDSSEAPPPKKRGRKPNVEKRKADEMIDEAPPAKRKRGRQQKQSIGGGEALDTSGRAVLQSILNNTYKHLVELEVADSETDEDGDKGGKRLIIGPFMSLPPKAQYADYYLIIRNPISMNQIKKKINREDYGSLRDFREDVRTLVGNAKTYNEDGSLLFQDAEAIDEACLSKLREETEDHPDLVDFDDQPNNTTASSSVVDGQSSTAPISSVGTPLAHHKEVPSGKLKLTFNANANGSGGMTNGAGRKGSDEDEDDDDGED